MDSPGANMLIFAAASSLIDIPLFPAISFNVAGLVSEDKMPRDCQLLRQILSEPQHFIKRHVCAALKGANSSYPSYHMQHGHTFAPSDYSHASSSYTLCLPPSHRHVLIIYGCLVRDQLIAGNPLVNRVLDTLPIDLSY